MTGCGGSGLVECFCAGDFCACSAQGLGRCEGCPDCVDGFWYEVELLAETTEPTEIEAQ